MSLATKMGGDHFRRENGVETSINNPFDVKDDGLRIKRGVIKYVGISHSPNKANRGSDSRCSSPFVDPFNRTRDGGEVAPESGPSLDILPHYLSMRAEEKKMFA